MKDPDEQLPEQIARRNWIVLAGLILLSLPWQSLSITLGVATGGILAIIGYWWLHRSLRNLLQEPSQSSAKSFRFSYFIRLGALAVALFVAIRILKVHPLGLIVGLSVVVINIFWATLQRSLFSRRQ